MKNELISSLKEFFISCVQKPSKDSLIRFKTSPPPTLSSAAAMKRQQTDRHDRKSLSSSIFEQFVERFFACMYVCILDAGKKTITAHVRPTN
jgi:hypothetical protein